MSATLAQIRAGLKTRLSTIAGLNASAYWPTQINCPQAFVRPLAMSERSSMGGYRVPTFEIWLLAAPQTAPLTQGQTALDLYLDEAGSKSLIVALEGDHTLGGIVTSLMITWADYSTIEVNGAEFYGAKLTVVVEP